MVPYARTNKKILVNVKSKNLKGLKVGTHFHNNCGLAHQILWRHTIVVVKLLTQLLQEWVEELEMLKQKCF